MVSLQFLTNSVNFCLITKNDYLCRSKTQTAMKKIITILCLTLGIATHAVAQITEVKVNALAGALTIINPSTEISLSDRSSATIDYVGIYAKDNFLGTGYPTLFTMGVTGYRRYAKGLNHDGFFYGMDFGFDMFRINKNVIPLVVNDKGRGYYDFGYGYLIGFSVGYKYAINERWLIEASVSGGWHYALHEGYSPEGNRLFELNPTAEWTPYKGGIYLIYRFDR